jgi:hypothetical protein
MRDYVSDFQRLKNDFSPWNHSAGRKHVSDCLDIINVIYDSFADTMLIFLCHDK